MEKDRTLLNKIPKKTGNVIGETTFDFRKILKVFACSLFCPWIRSVKTLEKNRNTLGSDTISSSSHHHDTINLNHPNMNNNYNHIHDILYHFYIRHILTSPFFRHHYHYFLLVTIDHKNLKYHTCFLKFPFKYQLLNEYYDYTFYIHCLFHIIYIIIDFLIHNLYKNNLNKNCILMFFPLISTSFGHFRFHILYELQMNDNHDIMDDFDIFFNWYLYNIHNHNLLVDNVAIKSMIFLFVIKYLFFNINDI